MQQRHLSIIFTALTLSLLAYTSSVLLFKAPVAHASAFVIGSDPVDGLTIASVPREVRVYFNAPISILSNAHVFVVQQGTQNSSLVEVGTNTGVISGSNSNELIISLKMPAAQELPQGSYLVRWAAVANADGRTTFGNIGFNVGSSSTGLSGTPILGPSTSNNLDEIRALDAGHATNILAVVWEWVTIAALTLLIGILIMEQFVLSDGGRCIELHVHTKKRASSLQRFCLFALFFSEIVSLVLRTTDIVENAHISNSSLSTMLNLLQNTDYGHFWLARFFLILSAMGLLYWTNQSGVGRRQENSPTRKGTPLSIFGTTRLVFPTAGGTGRGIRFSIILRSFLEYCNRVLHHTTLRLKTSQGERESVNSTGQVRGTVQSQGSGHTQGTGQAQGVAPAGSVRVRTGPVGIMSYPMPVSTETPSSPGIRGENRHSIAWLLLSGLLLLTVVLMHASAQTFQPHMSAILFDWLSLATLGIWFGSFVYLGYLILPLFNNKELEYHTETLATILRRLTPFILAAIGIELVSTLFLSEAAISEPQQLFSDPYGRTLLVQIVLLSVMLILTLYVLLWLQSRLKHQLLLLPLVHMDLPVRRLRQSELHQTKKSLGVMFIVITWLGVGILLCMALMTFLTPPLHFPAIAYSNQLPPSTNTTNAQTKQIGDLSVSLQLLPGRSDEANTVILLINDSNGKPVTDVQVRLTVNMQVMDMGTGNALIPAGNPVYMTTFGQGATFNMAGAWIINVEIQRPNQDAVKGTFQVMLSS